MQRISLEHKRKISEANKGRKFSLEHRKRLSESHMGQISSCGMLGKKHTIETKEKISKGISGILNPMYGKHHTEETRNKMSNIRKGIVFSEETRLKLSKANSGYKNPAWNGGTSSVKDNIRRTRKYKEWRWQVFIRDNFICQSCHKRGNGTLEAHHIKSFNKLLMEVKKYLPYNLYDGAMIYNPLWDINNGITLCKECHRMFKKNE